MFPVVIGHVTRLVELRRECADGDEIEIGRQFRQLPQIGNLVILDVITVTRRQASEGEQAEARQRRDLFVALYKARQRETKLGELFVVCAHTTHGDESDAFHRWLMVES